MSFPISITKCSVTINNITNNYGHTQKREGPGKDNTKKIQPMASQDKSKQQASPSQLTSKFSKVMDVNK